MAGPRFAALTVALLWLPGPPAVAGEADRILLETPSAVDYARHLRRLTEEPHPTGSPRDLALADYVRDRFREYGLADVRFHDTPALLPRGREAAVTIVRPIEKRLLLREAPHPADKDSYLYREPGIVPYHGYALSGDVTAEVVYASSGGPEDFARLESMGVGVRGRIVIMRYSDPYSYRGYKVWQAESRGAVGTILYSDPRDDGWSRGDTYPEGPWGPPSHVQWGAILYDWLGPGDPYTFHWTRGRDGTWVEGPVRHPQLPKIPSLPMSPEDAAEILKRLGGPSVPAGWQGGLPFTYHVGPGPVAVRLRVRNEESIGTIRNVIGVVDGAVERDRWVVIGNHRDAWIYGAVDPSGGTAALLEVARGLGAALRAGHRPRRTIVLANWAAEEELLGGSTSWVKDHRDPLLSGGVAYINVDSAASGPVFEPGASPELGRFLEETAALVRDPDTGGTLLDSWSRRFPGGRPQPDPVVGATDYTAFLEHIGMGCLDLAFGGGYGVYHSQYDNYYWLSRIGDPGFRYNLAMARLWGLLAWRLADAELLPFRYSDAARAVPGWIDDLGAKAAAAGIDLRLGAARDAAARWEAAARAFEEAAAARRTAAPPLPPGDLRRVNDLLLQVERALTEPEGLAGRPFFKHLLYAPQPTYRPEFLPRLFEAIERRDAAALPRHAAEIQAAFDRAAGILRQAREILARHGELDLG